MRLRSPGVLAAEKQFPQIPSVSSYLPLLCSVCFIPGLCLRIRRWLPTAATTSLDHSQQGAPSRPVV